MFDWMDEFAQRRLAPYITSKSRCLEVGAGKGVMARWMAERAGHVLAVDIETKLDTGPNLEVRKLDLTSDSIPEGWDVIHARQVLGLVTTPEDVMGKLVAALAPGGVLVCQESFSAWTPHILAGGDEQAREAMRRVDQATKAAVQEAPPISVDPTWSERLYAAMQDAGLVDLDAEVCARANRGGDPELLMTRGILDMLRHKLHGHGVTDEEINVTQGLLSDPRHAVFGVVAISVVGRRPE